MKFLKAKYVFGVFDNGTMGVNNALKPEVSRFRVFTTPSGVPILDVSYGVPPKSFSVIILPLKILFDSRHSLIYGKIGVRNLSH